MTRRVRKLALACACAGVVLAHATAGADEKQKQQHTVVVFDAPATLSPPRSPFARRNVTFTFHLAALQAPVGPVTITSTGLPGLTFSAAGQQGSIVRLRKIPTSGLPVTGSIDPERLREAGTDATAKIIVAAGEEWLEVPLTITPATPSYIWAPVIWFWSIIAPSAITVWVTTKVNGWLAGRQRSRDELRAWRQTLIASRAELDQIFRELFPNLDRNAPETWGSDLASRLDDWITKMPLPAAEEVYAALHNDPPEVFVPVLARYFPHWKTAILDRKEELRA